VVVDDCRRVDSGTVLGGMSKNSTAIGVRGVWVANVEKRKIGCNSENKNG